MTTTITPIIQKRVFTIAGRNNLAIVTDSKIPEGKTSGTFKKFEASTTQLACLKALNYELARMPKAKLDFKVAYLLPKVIGFLGYEDTRKFWITYGYKKSEFNPETNEIVSSVNRETGEVTTPDPINPELLEEVKKLDELLELQKNNVEIFRQESLTSPLYKAYRRVTWQMLTRFAPGEEVVSSNY